ncbi:TorF family putative porin [Microbulbifer sp. OS29]|uniref:TorF family putative porin n=1 Tax=Microbulbifer okhotskensis TaxID=2926617 RepID=A0A9X2J4Z7_9GAMM|nr:TorF family putative porin [Microbulbifer okhotskensis]MCO1335067.1 TorF family putative porin [Microbulbifer okhotskensis]
MKSKLKLSALTCVSLLVLAQQSQAELSSTVNLTTDYTFNGVSQTQNDPALQASLDYGFDSGWYIGTWASNVDFGKDEDTNLELDFYGGKFLKLNEKVSLDLGAAYYTYHGDEDSSDDYAYPEAYAKLGYSSNLGESEVNGWYSWDYFGTGAGHYIMMLAHTFEVAEGHNLRLSVDRSTSTNEDKWGWENGDSYNHYRVEYMTSYNDFDFNVAAENTNLNTDNADERIVLSVARKFSF